MLFSEIIGQAKVKQQLLESVSRNRVAHAQLFCGRSGVGKLPLAISYAQYLCCEHPTVDDSCGVCPSCIKFAKLVHPDLHLVFPIVKPESKSSVCDDFLPQFRESFLDNPYLGLDDWFSKISDGKQGMIYSNESDEIIRKLNLKTFEARYKIMIIWMPERMHEACANKLLKVLEEPFENTVFILVSDSPEELLATIRSRVQNINIPPIESFEISTALQQQYHLSEHDADTFARMSGGSFLLASRLSGEFDSDQRNLENFMLLMRLAWKSDFQELRAWSEALEKTGRESVKSFLQYVQRMIRENFILNLRLPSLNYMTVAERDFSMKFSVFINERNIQQMTDEFQTAEREIEQNVNIKIVLFDMALKCIDFLKK